MQRAIITVKMHLRWMLLERRMTAIIGSMTKTATSSFGCMWKKNKGLANIKSVVLYGRGQRFFVDLWCVYIFFAWRRRWLCHVGAKLCFACGGCFLQGLPPLHLDKGLCPLTPSGCKTLFCLCVWAVFCKGCLALFPMAVALFR